MEHVLISFLTIILCGVGAQWLSWRFHIPAIALFLLTGFLVGPVMGWVEPGFLRNDLLYATVSTFVAVILFEGSLQLKWRELRESGAVIGHLIFMGGLLTMVLGALGGCLILGLEPRMAVLLGAILIVTGPTVVLPLLRQIRPAGRLGAILKWEGIAIDPLGALIAVLIYEVILSEGPRQVLGIFTVGIFKTIVFGSLIGLLGAGIIIVAFRKYLVPEHLRNPFILALVVAVFISSALLGNEPTGFLSVTLMGIVLANQGFVPIHGMVVFKETLKSLILPTLFIILAARLPMSDLPRIDLQALAFFLFIVLIVRPAAVFLSTRFAGLTWQERLFLSFMAPRGIVAAAVASLFSERLVAAGFPQAGPLVILVFFLVSSTVIFYAVISPVMAHVLKLARPRSSGILVFGASKFAISLCQALKAEGVDVVLVDGNREHVMRARVQGLEAIKEDIFSEDILELVEERGLGRLLALTQNVEANSLAIEHFRHLMDPGELYQLSPPSKSKLRQGHHLVGRILFGEDVSFRFLEDKAEKGADIKPFAGGEGVVLPENTVLFAKDMKGKVSFSTADEGQAAAADRVLFALLSPGPN